MKILISAGGTAGHLFPAISLISALEKKIPNSEIILVLTKRQSKFNSFLNPNHKTIYLDIGPLALSLNLQNLISVVKLIKAFFYSCFLCVIHKPDVAVGFGSYASSIVVLAAVFARVPTLIHDQNVASGRANRILSNFVDKVCVSFDKTEEHYKRKHIEVSLTGNPLRSDLKKIQKDKALSNFQLDKDKFTILITGGSQGSRNINILFINALSLLPRELISNIQIIHATGVRDNLFITDKYKSLGLKFCVFDFISDMSSAYSACDLFIGRAGAMTITEISYLKVAAIIIPYLYAYTHQRENGLLLERHGACIMLEESSLSKDLLKNSIICAIRDPDSLSRMRENIGKFFMDKAQDRLCEEVIKLTRLNT